MEISLLRELVIVLAASVLIIYISHKLKLPSVVGFLLTGVLIGPGGLSLVKNNETVQTLAEIGVVMLLFTIGLEFEPARLKRIRRNFWAGGSLQVVADHGGLRRSSCRPPEDSASGRPSSTASSSRSAARPSS